MNQRCPHSGGTAEVIPVGTDEVVARLCESCHARLPIWWGCPDCDTEVITVTEYVQPIARVLVEPCGTDHTIPLAHSTRAVSQLTYTDQPRGTHRP